MTITKYFTSTLLAFGLSASAFAETILITDGSLSTVEGASATANFDTANTLDLASTLITILIPKKSIYTGASVTTTSPLLPSHPPVRPPWIYMEPIPMCVMMRQPEPDVSN